LLVVRATVRAEALDFDFDLDFLMGSSEATPSAAPPQPRPGKTPAGQDSEARIRHFKVTIATLRSNP
jgi:hypothetical protein